jgi:hypothetical protein
MKELHQKGFVKFYDYEGNEIKPGSIVVDAVSGSRGVVIWEQHGLELYLAHCPEGLKDGDTFTAWAIQGHLYCGRKFVSTGESVTLEID